MHKSLIQAVTAAALLTLASSAWAQRNWDAPKLVTSYCSGCHGVDGNTALPYFPKLAGLNATYAEKKMTAFREPSGPPVDEFVWWVLKVNIYAGRTIQVDAGQTVISTGPYAWVRHPMYSG